MIISAIKRFVMAIETRDICEPAPGHLGGALACGGWTQ
jgi:hypothetical protein